jgi:dihydrofolate reductase
MSDVPFSIVLAVDQNGLIGCENRIPWSIPEDMKHFRELTTSVKDPSKRNAVIMGRKTWESLPEQHRPLKGRINIVISHQPASQLTCDGALLANNLHSALKLATQSHAESIFVIGGAQLYSQAFHDSRCKSVFVTHVKPIEPYNGDQGVYVDLKLPSATTSVGMRPNIAKRLTRL